MFNDAKTKLGAFHTHIPNYNIILSAYAYYVVKWNQ